MQPAEAAQAAFTSTGDWNQVATAVVRALWKPVSQLPPKKRKRFVLVAGGNQAKNSRVSRIGEIYPDRTHFIDPRDLAQPVTPEDQAWESFSGDKSDAKAAFLAGVALGRAQASR